MATAFVVAGLEHASAAHAATALHRPISALWAYAICRLKLKLQGTDRRHGAWTMVLLNVWGQE
eukprot:42546-Pleurochrysis_carterae.AAC.6